VLVPDGCGLPLAASTDWTEIGVLLTAGFTGGIVLFTALAYRVAQRDARRRERTLYKFPLVEIE